MEMEMIHEFLRPGVEHGNETELALKVPPRVFCKYLKRFLDCGKKDVEGNFFVAEYKGI